MSEGPDMENYEKTVIALVPMRHHSQRVPGKNYRPLSGRPLCAYILGTLQNCPEVTSIWVDTDSPEIQRILQEEFPSVKIIERPEHLQADDISMNDIIGYDLEKIDGHFFLQTHSTNPLLKASTISAAVRAFFEHFPEKDSLFTVTRLYNRLWDADGNPINHDPEALIQTQELPPTYLENSCLYIFDKEIFLQRRNRIGAQPQLFEIPPAEAWDIDFELDFTVVESLMAERLKDSSS